MARGNIDDRDEPVEVTVIKVPNRGIRARTIGFVIAGLAAVFGFALITKYMTGNDAPVVVDAATTIRSATTFATATLAPTTTEDPSTTVVDTTAAPTTSTAPTTTVFWVPLPADFLKPTTTTTAKPRSTKATKPAFIPVPDFMSTPTAAPTTQPPATVPPSTDPATTAPGN